MATRRTFRRKRIGPGRRPAVGLLAPGQSLVLPIDPPMQPGEQPVVMTPQAGDVLLRDAAIDRVTVVNQTNDRVVAYFMAIVPSTYIKAAMIPWGRVASDVGYAVRKSGVLQRLGQLLAPKRLP